jgi:hypothetical protein
MYLSKITKYVEMHQSVLIEWFTYVTTNDFNMKHNVY